MKNILKNKFISKSLLVVFTTTMLSTPSIYAKTVNKTAYKPVTLSNYTSLGTTRKVSFTKAPKRAICLNQATTEIMLSLGLEKSMVGTCYLDDVIMPSLQKAYKKIPVLSAEYPSKEIVIAKKPDFLFGWKSAFYPDTLGETINWDKQGVKTYISKSTVTKDKKIQYVYDDVLNIGKIFGVENKAIALVNSMKTKVNMVQKKIGHVKKPLRVAIIQNIRDNKLDCRGGSKPELETEMVKIAGGTSVFSDIKDTWGMNMEMLIEKNPDVIVINDLKSSVGTPAVKIKMLKSNPALSEVSAIKHNRFVIIPLTEAYGGSIRTADGVVRLAKGFYPAKFKK